MHWNATRGQILNFQNTFDRAYEEIRMEIQTDFFFGSLISTILDLTVTNAALHGDM
jgi:hypothetical protein